MSSEEFLVLVRKVKEDTWKKIEELMGEEIVMRDLFLEEQD